MSSDTISNEAIVPNAKRLLWAGFMAILAASKQKEDKVGTPVVMYFGSGLEVVAQALGLRAFGKLKSRLMGL